MLEVKADALEASFDAMEQDEAGVAALKQELEALKKRVSDGAIAAQAPRLDGVKSAETRDFVDGYMRRGTDAGVELKALDNATGGAGGFAIPREIDEKIEKT